MLFRSLRFLLLGTMKLAGTLAGVLVKPSSAPEENIIIVLPLKAPAAVLASSAIV